MALGKPATAFSGDLTRNNHVVDRPRFVDNSVRHAVCVKELNQFKVSKPAKNDFVPTNERKYKLIEEQETVKLTHNPTESQSYSGPVFYDRHLLSYSETSSKIELVDLPPLMISSENKVDRLVLSEIKTKLDFTESTNLGTRYFFDGVELGNGSKLVLKNMKDKSLSDIGFTSKTVHLGQKVGVGLRTSDMAMRVVTSNPSSINSFMVTNHSNSFIAQDFYGVEASTALRFISKHDGYSARTDQYGNLQYVSQNKFNKEHFITESRTSGFIENKAEYVPNRVIVRGKNRANNDENVIQIDDFGDQETGINEIPGGIFAPTSLSKKSSRKIGQRVLKMAKNAQNGVTIEGVQNAPNMHPGDAVTYQSLSDRHREIIISSKQDLINKVGDLTINAVDATLEDILQRFQEGDITNSFDNNEDRNKQFTVEEFSTSAGFKFKVSWEIRERVDENNGIGTVIGDPRSSIIHGETNYETTANFSIADYPVDYMNASPVVGTGLKVQTGGTGYGASATYTNLTTTGGTGNGLKVNITTVNNVITEAVVHTAGSGYELNDVVTVVKIGGSNGTLRLTSTIEVDNGSGGATTAIAPGTKIFRSNGALVGTVAASTTTSVTFESGINHKIDNNEVLLKLGTIQVPSAGKLKIGNKSSNYLIQRRG